MQREWTRYGGLCNHLIASLYPIISRKKRRQAGDQQFESYYKFGFVRNPWDRVVSLYLRKEGLQMRDKMTFDEFVDWIKYSSSTCNHPVPHTNQLDWLIDPHGNILMDYTGKLETLSDDWKITSKWLSIKAELPHKYRNSDKKHYSEYYNEKTKEIMRKKFIIDIELFEYEFDSWIISLTWGNQAS